MDIVLGLSGRGKESGACELLEERLPHAEYPTSGKPGQKWGTHFPLICYLKLDLRTIQTW